MPREDAAQFNGTLSTATYPNRYSAVIPVEAPFYRIGLTLTVTDKTTGTKRKLIEGLDYFLGHYFQELAEAENDAIYGSIMLLNATEVEYELLSVGRQYRIPASEIGKYLVKTDMKDPRNCDWSELMKYPPIISPIDPPKDLEEAILRDEIVKALEDIRLGILERAHELDQAFAEVTDLIYQNGKQVFDDEMYQHHLIKNAHGYTCGDIGALPVLGKAVDATKAFGRTLAELVTLMSTSGIQQKHVDMLLDNTLGDLLGRMRVLNNDAITFQTTSGHVISMKGEKFIITSTKPLVLKADQDNNEPGIATEFSAGLNTLWVHSGKAGDKWGAYDAGVLAPVYNGVYLVTPDMVKMYLTSVKILPANAYFKSSDTLKIYGSGKETNKVYMNAELPAATTTVQGLFAITNLSASAASSTAISQKAVTDLKNKLDGYVDDTYTVNGKGFVLDENGQMHLTLTALDFGIEKMNNTGPLEKPVTNALRTVLSGKALSTHTHTIADLDNVPYASTSVTGLAKLWDAIDTTTDKMVTARQGFLLEQKIGTLNDKIATLLPAWTVGGSSYGNNNFLPIPVQGNYEGYTKNQTWQKGLARYEAGKVYSLRNGSNGNAPADWAIYYAYADVTADNTLTNMQQTSVRYRPAGMSAYPGVNLVAIVITGTDAMICLGSDGAYYLVIFDGTIDHAKHHRVVKVVLGAYKYGNGAGTVTTAPWAPNVTTDDLIVCNERVYLLRTVLTSGDYFVSMRSIALNELNLGGSNTFVADALTGGILTSGENVYLRLGQKRAPSDALPAPVTQIYADALAKWNNAINFVHGPECNHAIGVDGLKFRVGLTPTVWFASSTGQTISFKQWVSSFVVDCSALTVTLEGADRFPIVADLTAVRYNGGTEIGIPSRKWGEGQANNQTFATSQDKYIVSQGHAGDRDLMPIVVITTLDDGVSWYEYLSCDYNFTARRFSAVTLNQGRGSIYELGMAYPLTLGADSRLIWLSQPRSRLAIEVEFDPNTTYSGKAGYGPTNNRRLVDSITYENLSQMCHIVTPASPGTELNGWYCTGPETFPYHNVSGTFTIHADRLTLSQAEWNKMKQMIIDGAPAGAANGYASEYILAANNAGKALFSVWFIGIGTATPLTLAQVACTRTVNNVNVLDIYYFTLKPTISNGQVTFPAAILSLFDFYNNLDYGLKYATLGEITGGKTRRPGQPTMVSVDGTQFGLYLPHTLTLQQIGDLGALNYAVGLTLSNGTWTRSSAPHGVGRMAPSHTPVSPAYLAHRDQVMLHNSSLNYVYCGGIATSSRDFVTAPNFSGPTESVVIAGVETAEGWLVYVTEEVNLRFGSSIYKLPTWYIDLSAAFPTNHQNRTFYLHAKVENGTPKYVMDVVQHPDTETELYIGYVKTGSSRVVETNVDHAKRLGAVKQLLEHAAVENKHDVEVGRDAATGRLAPLRKEAMGPLSVDATKGYLDSQLLYTVSDAQRRGKAMVSKRFEGLKTLPAFTQANKSGAFWKHPTTIATVTADENSEATSLGMEWVGIPTPAFAPTSTNLMVVVQSKFVVPGTPGVETTFNVHVAPWEAVDGFFYNVEAEGTDVNIDENPEVLLPSPHTVHHKQHSLPAGVPCTFTFVAAVSSSALETANQHICSWLFTDAGGLPITTDLSDSKIQILPHPGETHGTPVVLNSRSYTFTNVAGAIPVVTTGAQGLFPPPIMSWSGDNLTLTIAHDWVNERGRQQPDVIQVNLMFRT